MHSSKLKPHSIDLRAMTVKVLEYKMKNIAKFSFLQLIFLIIGLQIAYGQPKFEAGQKFTLPAGVKVKIVGHVPPKKGRDNVAMGLVLAVESDNVSIKKLEKISDQFFGLFWGPRIESQGKKRGKLYIQVPGTKRTTGKNDATQTAGILRNLEYERRGKGWWVPAGRPIPDWLKAPNPREVQLSNGEIIWLEKIGPFYSQLMKRKTIALAIVGNWTSTTTGAAFEQIRRLAAEKLSESRQKHELIMITNLNTPSKGGFHFRNQVKAFVLRKSPDDFWLVQKFQYAQFSEGGHAAMIWYVPSVPYGKTTPEMLAEEASLLHSQFGARLAEKWKLKTSIIMAIWPPNETGERVWRHGTLFVKGPNGKWQLRRNKKKN